MSKILTELLEQVNDIHRQMENLEDCLDELHKRIDAEIEKEGGI